MRAKNFPSRAKPSQSEAIEELQDSNQKLVRTVEHLFEQNDQLRRKTPSCAASCRKVYVTNASCAKAICANCDWSNR